MSVVFIVILIWVALSLSVGLALHLTHRSPAARGDFPDHQG
jgi:hypothetical protein